MNHRIIGTTLPVLEAQLAPGESIVSVAGQLSWMSQSIDLHTSTAHGGGGGFFGILKRVAGGGSLFMTEFTARSVPGFVAFATHVPGHILPVAVGRGRSYMIHRHGFLCATPGVELSVGFQQSLGAGIFGGDGFLLQRLAGECEAFVELDGEVVPYDLAPGESLRVHPGHVGMFEEGVNFGITRIQGIRNMLFGGDGVFLAQLTGPGRVWLQSLPLANLAHALTPYISTTSERVTETGTGAIIGSVLRGLTQK